MSKLTKNRKLALEKLDKDKQYTLKEAAALVKETSHIKRRRNKSQKKQKRKNVGYYFFHEDYVKLKIMDFMVHKDAVQTLLDKEIK